MTNIPDKISVLILKKTKLCPSILPYVKPSMYLQATIFFVHTFFLINKASLTNNKEAYKFSMPQLNFWQNFSSL